MSDLCPILQTYYATEADLRKNSHGLLLPEDIETALDVAASKHGVSRDHVADLMKQNEAMNL